MKLQFDPTKVTRVALESTASIAAMLHTTEPTGRRSRAIGPDAYRTVGLIKWHEVRYATDQMGRSCGAEQKP